MRPRTPLLIAIVDDEGSVRTSLHRFLAAAHLDSATFASGREFLESLRARCPDCLILDLQMPELSGLDVQRQLAAGGVQVPTIIITADDDPDTRERCRLAGSIAYLCKPFDGQTLLTLIDRALDPTGGAGPHSHDRLR
jgi:FixJ family two-component response regulator